MTSNPFQAELQRRQLARSATRTNEQRMAALELFAVSLDGRRLEAIRKLHPAIAEQLEAMHEANLKAKARAWEERHSRRRSAKNAPRPFLLSLSRFLWPNSRTIPVPATVRYCASARPRLSTGHPNNSLLKRPISCW